MFWLLYNNNMGIYLGDLLSSNIFSNYQVLSGKTFLNKEVEKIAILETPDFEKYVQSKSLILTTLYPIKSDLPLFKKLIQVLAQKEVAGLVVKLKRYVDIIPEDIVQRCEQAHLPLITIDYDANLSEISTNILNEIATQSLRTISLTTFYLDLVKTLDENPKIESILGFKERFESMDYWIYSHLQQKAISTNPSLNEVAEKLANQPLTYQKNKSYHVYVDAVKLSNQLLYQVVFFFKQDHRSKMHYYAEIIKMMLVFIYQKRKEMTLQQNQFLLETLTVHKVYPHQDIFLEKADIYGWKLTFPLMMIVVDMKSTLDKVPLQGTEIKEMLMNIAMVDKDQIRFIYLNQRLVFLLNDFQVKQLDQRLRMMVKDLDQRFPLLDIRIALSQQLTEIGLIATAYDTLTKGLQMIHQRHLKEKVLTSQSMRLIALFNKLSIAEMKDFVQSVIGPLLTYEKKHGGNLLETLDRLITNQFHLKKTADMMFIHYNTLRHRLRILEQLGYQKGVLDTNRYDFILAVYIATNVLDASERD